LPEIECPPILRKSFTAGPEGALMMGSISCPIFPGCKGRCSIQIKKLSTIKFHNFSKFTTFILVVLSFEIVWKTQTIKDKNIFSGGSLRKPP
jgi:hypothetical protein